MLLESQRGAKNEAAAVKNCKELSREILEEHMRRYIYFKYMIMGEKIDTDNMDELANLSLSKSLKIDRSLLEGIDSPSACGGASSVIMKKVLLYLALQRDFGFEFNPTDTANAITVHDLAVFAWEAINCCGNKSAIRGVM